MMLTLTPLLSLAITPLLLLEVISVRSFAHVSAAATPIAFINPPPLREQDRDDSKNAVYPIGSTMHLQWTEDQTVRSSLVLYQVVDGGGFEYIAPNHIQLTDYGWIVNTAKNLSLCNVFQLALFSNGHTAPDAMSHYFNITSASNSLPSSSSSLLTATMTSATTGITQTALKTSIGGEATTTDAGAKADGKGNGNNPGVSTPAAIGIGIGVSSAIFLFFAIAGAVVYHWVFRRRRRQTNQRNRTTTLMGDDDNNNNDNNEFMAELPPPQTITPHHMAAHNMGVGGGLATVVMMNGNGYGIGNEHGDGNRYPTTTTTTTTTTRGELPGHNGLGRKGGSSVYEVDARNDW